MKTTMLFLPASFVIVLLLVAGCTTQTGMTGTATPPPGISTDNGLKLVASDGNAHLYSAGNISVIRLKGSYREMGQQYGRLMAKEIPKMYDTVVAQIGQPGFVFGVATEDDLVNYSMAQYAYYPQQYKEVVEGIAETSGVPVSHIVVIDQLVPDYSSYPQTELSEAQLVALFSGSKDVIFGNASATTSTVNAASHHCSSVIAWGNYTGNGPLVMGRNFDFGKAFRNFDPYLSVIVYNPDDGSVPTAVIGWPGSVGGIEAFNEAGLVMETNDNSHVTAPNNVLHHNRIPLNLLTLGLVKDSATFAQFDAAMNSTRFGYPLLANVATPEQGYTYEWGSRDVVRRGDTNPGLQVIANYPLSPFWNETIPSSDLATGYSLSRRANLMNLSEQHKGSLDTSAMESIFDTPYSQGGATFGTASLGDSVTVYQFVYVPETRTLTLKAPGYDTWTTIELAPLFRD
jgi:hypothetical protein